MSDPDSELADDRAVWSNLPGEFEDLICACLSIRFLIGHTRRQVKVGGRRLQFGSLAQ